MKTIKVTQAHLDTEYVSDQTHPLALAVAEAFPGYRVLFLFGNFGDGSFYFINEKGEWWQIKSNSHIEKPFYEQANNPAHPPVKPFEFRINFGWNPPPQNGEYGCPMRWSGPSGDFEYQPGDCGI